MNLIDFTKAENAALAITDAASREVVQEIIPVLQAAVTAIVNGAQDRIDASVGNALAAATAEREQIVNDVHALLDRINGTKLLLTQGGFRLEIPERLA